MFFAEYERDVSLWRAENSHLNTPSPLFKIVISCDPLKEVLPSTSITISLLLSSTFIFGPSLVVP
ncbi:hypothetical protein D3C85_1136960 [compost metagenome]